jgi:hypothetical protein
MTTSHLTNPAKDAGQVIGYSHSTGETTSQSTKPPKNGGKVAGYRLETTPAKSLVMQGGGDAP